MRKIDVIILAAGYSSRAKAFKMNLYIDDMTVLEHTMATFEGYCERVIVVTGYKHMIIESIVEKIKSSNCYSFDIELIYNEAYDLGMFSSIQKGCEVVKSNQFFLTPGDCPLVKGKTISCLIDQEGDVIIPSYNYHGGHPILLSTQVKDEVLKENVSSNLRKVIERFNKKYVTVEDEGILLDIDTYEDYERIIKYE